MKHCVSCLIYYLMLLFLQGVGVCMSVCVAGCRSSVITHQILMLMECLLIQQINKKIPS